MNARGMYRRIALRRPQDDAYSDKFLYWVQRNFPEWQDKPPWWQWFACQASYKENNGQDIAWNYPRGREDAARMARARLCR